jgi:predicted Zn-dependent protease
MDEISLGRRWRLGVTRAAVAAFVVLACATSPLGRSQLILMSEAEMEQMGVTAFDQLQRERPISKDSAATGSVRCVAAAVTREVRQVQGISPDVRIPARWEVQLFADDSANAFALPGGKIGVHTGLLRVARSQGQLAAVIGHEVGHVLARHSNERVSDQAVAQYGVAAAGQLLGAIGNSGSTGQQVIYQALGVGTQLGLMRFSRQQESEADLIGLNMMALAGFDPRESVELWRNMERASQGQPPEFLSTHPSHGTRIRELEARIPAQQEVWKRAIAQGRKPSCAMPGGSR